MPSSGKIGGLPCNSDVRVDTGFEIGDVFPDAYDSLVEKVIAHGTNRTEAIAALRDHLEAKVTTGITTNTGYLARLCNLNSFISGGVHTGLLEDEASALMKAAATSARLAGLAAIGVQIVREAVAGPSARPFAAADGWRLNAAPSLTVRFGLDTGVLTTHIQSDETQISARIDGDHAVVARRNLQVAQTESGWTVVVTTSPTSDKSRRAKGAATLLVDDIGATLIEAGEVWTYPFPIADAAADALEAVDDLKATLPGKIAAINFEAGAQVKKGDVLVVLEAMKMEHSLTASRDGVIGEVVASVGKQVRAGEILVKLVAEATTA